MLKDCSNKLISNCVPCLFQTCWQVVTNLHKLVDSTDLLQNITVSNCCTGVLQLVANTSCGQVVRFLRVYSCVWEACVGWLAEAVYPLQCFSDQCRVQMLPLYIPFHSLGSKFPPSFGTSVKKFIKLLFHVLGHLYYSHIENVSELQLHPYLNTVFIHIMYFDNKFSLLEAKDTVPLDDLAHAMNLSLEPKQS